MSPKSCLKNKASRKFHGVNHRYKSTLLALQLAIVSAGFLAQNTAHARAVRDQRYAVDRTWNTTIRLLRVDLGFTITERDRDAGILLFNYRGTNQETPGSIQLIATEVDGAISTRVIVQIPRQPTYVEYHLITMLERKLREEYGDPPPLRRPTPTQPTQPTQPPGTQPTSPTQPGNEGNPPATPAQPPTSGSSTEGANRDRASRDTN